MIYQIITLVTPHCKRKAVNLYNLVGWTKYLNVFVPSRNGLVVNLFHPHLHPNPIHMITVLRKEEQIIGHAHKPFHIVTVAESF